jgi:hypothetical protein
MAPRYPWKFTTRDIAEATGYSVHMIRRDRRAGKLNESALSLSAYIRAALLEQQARKAKAFAGKH